MQLLSRSLEKHPLAITISLWTTFFLSHHSCSYSTTTLSYHQPLEMAIVAFSHLLFLLPFMWANTPPYPTPFQSPDCCSSHWMLTPILCCFPAVRSWGGSLLWLLHGENQISWNALVRLLCCCSSGGGLAGRSHRHCEVGLPRRIPRQNTQDFIKNILTGFPSVPGATSYFIYFNYSF